MISLLCTNFFRSEEVRNFFGIHFSPNSYSVSWIYIKEAWWFFSSQIWPFLNRASFLEAARVIVKIGFRLKPNHHKEIQVAQICETLCIYRFGQAKFPNCRSIMRSSLFPILSSVHCPATSKNTALFKSGQNQPKKKESRFINLNQ